MTAVGAWLLAIGLADLVAGLSGQPGSALRVRCALVVAPSAGLLTGLAGGLPPEAALAVATLAGVGTWPWISTRRVHDWSARHAAVTLLAAGTGVAAVVASAGHWPNADGGPIARWLAGLPYPLLAGTGSDRMLLGAGVGVVLLASGNAVVRLVLAAAGARTLAAEQRLRGGRVVGPLERVLILGFASPVRWPQPRSWSRPRALCAFPSSCAALVSPRPAGC